MTDLFLNADRLRIKVKETVRMHADCPRGMQASALDAFALSENLDLDGCELLAILAEKYHPYMQKFSYSSLSRQFEACAP